MMATPAKRGLRRATIVYWVLLLYIIAALIWWFITLERQNSDMYRLRLMELEQTAAQRTPSARKAEEARMLDERERATTKHLAEGLTFLALILLGAGYVYRLVRRQFQVQHQQQNFVMAVTHELKTPIAATLLNLETLQKHHLDPQRQARLIGATLQETMRLDTLINNILLSARLEGSAYALEKEVLDLSDLVQEATHQFSARYPARPVQTRIEPAVSFEGDALLLKLLVSNLLENAQKYSPREAPVRISLTADRQGPTLQVSDNGPGIPLEERKKVFLKFYRIGNEDTRRTKGTGLGLYLCLKIAQEHGGSITVSDSAPNGSTFTVALPANA